MKLTCVTAVFDAIKSGDRDRLIRCVESVAKLKTEHEHLIYDGASTDGTVELLRELEAKTPGLKVVSEPDTGIYNALNKGVRDAKGDWYHVLGADDYIVNPTLLDETLSKIDHYDMVVSTVMRDDGELQFTKFKQLRSFAFTNVYSHQGVLLRTYLVRCFGGFDEYNLVSADYDMFWKAHKLGVRIKYIYNPFAFYAKGGFSASSEIGGRYDPIVFARHLGVNQEEFVRRFERGYPLAKVLPLFHYKDKVLRMCARFLIYYRIKCYFRPIYGPIKKWLKPGV